MAYEYLNNRDLIGKSPYPVFEKTNGPLFTRISQILFLQYLRVYKPAVKRGFHRNIGRSVYQQRLDIN